MVHFSLFLSVGSGPSPDFHSPHALLITSLPSLLHTPFPHTHPGTITANIGKLTALERLELYSTQISGASLVRGKFLSVGPATTDYNPKTCFLTTFPPPLPVHAPNNKGKMPPEIGKLVALQYLDFGWTKLSGRFVGCFDWSIVFVTISRLRLTETSTLNHASSELWLFF